ncbi:hypothetical protein Trydic_g14640 [Trypoxylus dichotomus]
MFGNLSILLYDPLRKLIEMLYYPDGLIADKTCFWKTSTIPRSPRRDAAIVGLLPAGRWKIKGERGPVFETHPRQDRYLDGVPPLRPRYNQIIFITAHEELCKRISFLSRTPDKRCLVGIRR